MREIKNNKINNIDNLLTELEEKEEFDCFWNSCTQNWEWTPDKGGCYHASISGVSQLPDAPQLPKGEK